MTNRNSCVIRPYRKTSTKRTKRDTQQQKKTQSIDFTVIAFPLCSPYWLDLLKHITEAYAISICFTDIYNMAEM